MSFYVRSTNARRRVVLISIIFSCFLIAMIIFHQQSTQTFLDTPILSGIIEQNKVLHNEYVARIHQPLSSSILRGILIFYPHDQEVHFLPEILWLYRSWIEMMKDEPSLWRTDLVIYTGNYTSNLEQLGCIYNQIRLNRQEPPQCRVFPYERIRLRDAQHNSDPHLYQQLDKDRSRLLITHLQNYEYVDSMNIIAEYYPSYAIYDYILRTDIDVFLTKYFGRSVPYNDTFLVGHSAYATEFSIGRLRRVAKNMNWLYANLTNPGSTWYGSPQIAQRIANFSLEAMIYLSINEFTTPEKQEKLNSQLWPEWHYAALLLYGSHLAFNHLVLNESINLGLAYELLDQVSTNKDQYDLEKNNRLHLHCSHTLDTFSKFRFKIGEYNHLNPNSYINNTSAAGFALRMALESRIMSFADLKQGLMNAKNLPNV